MAGEVDKLLEKLPVADGRFRRRMMAGGIVVLVSVLTYRSDMTFIGASIGWGDILSAPSLLLVFLVIVYALGGVINIQGQIFVIRAVGEAIHFFRSQFKKKENESWGITAVIWAVKAIPAFYIVYLAFLKGLLGNTGYKIDLAEQNLSPAALDAVGSMPGRVRDGIIFPLGNNADFAIQYMETSLDERSRKYIHGKFRNSREMLVFLSSLVVCAPIVFLRFFDQIVNVDPAVSSEFAVTIALQAVGILIILLFRGYFILLHSAIGDLVELYAGVGERSLARVARESRASAA